MYCSCQTHMPLMGNFGLEAETMLFDGSFAGALSACARLVANKHRQAVTMMVTLRVSAHSRRAGCD